MEVGNGFRRLDYVGPGPNIMLFGFLWMQLYKYIMRKLPGAWKPTTPGVAGGKPNRRREVVTAAVA